MYSLPDIRNEKKFIAIFACVFEIIKNENDTIRVFAQN